MAQHTQITRSHKIKEYSMKDGSFFTLLKQGILPTITLLTMIIK